MGEQRSVFPWTKSRVEGPEMAKQSAGTDFEKILNSIPRRAEFEIVMNADSTTEVWADIDTGIDDGQGWVIYGLEYVYESIDPTVPLIPFNAGADNEHVLQVHRNDDSELLLNSNDNRLLLQHRVGYDLFTSGQVAWEQPSKIPARTVTLSPTLRVLFRTSVDNTFISLATVQIAGAILYDVVRAPARISSKIGTLADL